jgi:hypothetical protein
LLFLPQLIVCVACHSLFFLIQLVDLCRMSLAALSVPISGFVSPVTRFAFFDPNSWFVLHVLVALSIPYSWFVSHVTALSAALSLFVSHVTRCSFCSN